MTIESITRQGLRSRVSDAQNDLVVEGTASSATNNTLVAPELTHDDDALIDAWIHIYEGTGAGQERLISDNSQSANSVTIANDWTTNPDATSKFEIHSQYRVAQYNRAIADALRRFRWHFPQPSRDRSILTNNNLLNGLFADWANGASSNPDNWSTSGAAIQQAVLRQGDPITVGTMSHRAVVWASTTRVQFVSDDGTTTKTASHDGSGWNELVNTLAMADAATALTHKITNSGASSVSSVARESNNKIRGDYALKITWDNGDVAYVDSVFSPGGYATYEYAAPSNFRSAHQIDLERSFGALTQPLTRNASVPIPRTYWTGGIGGVNPARFIRFFPEDWTPEDNRMLIVHGMAVPDIPSADTDVLQVDIAPIVDWAIYYMHRTDPDYAVYRRDAIEAVSNVRVAWPANTIKFDPN